MSNADQFAPLAMAKDWLSTPAGRDPELLEWARKVVEEEELREKVRRRLEAKAALGKRALKDA